MYTIFLKKKNKILDYNPQNKKIVIREIEQDRYQIVFFIKCGFRTFKTKELSVNIYKICFIDHIIISLSLMLRIQFHL